MTDKVDKELRSNMDKQCIAISGEGEVAKLKDGSVQLDDNGNVIHTKLSAAMLNAIRQWISERNSSGVPKDDDGFEAAIKAAQKSPSFRKPGPVAGKIPPLSTDDDAASHP